MEITITDTAETAKLKRNILNKRMTSIFRNPCILFAVFGLIFFITGLNSDFSHFSVINGHTTYYTYHLGVGIGAGMLVTSGYLGIYLWKFNSRMKNYNHGITKYTFSNTGINTESNELQSFINWNTIEKVHVSKIGFLIATNNYSCPTIFILKSQISDEELNWIKSQIR